jgi:hypothetical protein
MSLIFLDHHKKFCQRKKPKSDIDRLYTVRSPTITNRHTVNTKLMSHVLIDIKLNYQLYCLKQKNKPQFYYLFFDKLETYTILSMILILIINTKKEIAKTG